MFSSLGRPVVIELEFGVPRVESEMSEWSNAEQGYVRKRFEKMIERGWFQLNRRVFKAAWSKKAWKGCRTAAINNGTSSWCFREDRKCS